VIFQEARQCIPPVALRNILVTQSLINQYSTPTFFEEASSYIIKDRLNFWKLKILVNLTDREEPISRFNRGKPEFISGSDCNQDRCIKKAVV